MGQFLQVVVGVSDQDRSILRTLNFTIAQPVVVEGIIDYRGKFLPPLTLPSSQKALSPAAWKPSLL